MNLHITERKSDYRQFHKEGFRKIYRHLMYTFLFAAIFGISLVVLGAIFKIWPIMINGCIVCILECIMAVATIRSNKKDIDRMEKNFEKNNGEQTDVVYEFGDDVITKKYWDGYGVKMLYIDAKSLIETEHYLMITFKHDYIYYISKDFITPTEIEAVKELCKSKNPKVKSYKM